MAPFLYRCPNNGQRVQGWSAEEVSPDQADIYETVTCIAGRLRDSRLLVGALSRTCSASPPLTNPRSAPLELQAAVPDYMVPFAPIMLFLDCHFVIVAERRAGAKRIQQPG
jgi:hypothetical protein